MSCAICAVVAAVVCAALAALYVACHMKEVDDENKDR